LQRALRPLVLSARVDERCKKGEAMEKFDAYVEANAERFIEELKEFCRQPSIAAQGIGLEEMGELVQARLEKVAAEVRLMPVDDGPPIIYAELGEGQRTLLFYNHYDVQPPDPLDLWDSGPFAPQVREGKLYARGVADNKGDLLARLQAIEAYQAILGELPLKIKCVFEGEEEVGSPHLASFAAEHADLLAADGCLWETGRKDESGRPTIALGLKGIMYLELRAHGAKSDLHSSLATLVPNPAWRLVWALSTLKDEDDNILVDGLMGHVAEPAAAEMEMLAAIPFEEEKMRANFGIPQFIRGLTGVEALKKHLYEPTCTICGLRSGYIGEGTKTVLPNTAMVKLDFRLVPNLEPDLVVALLRQHLDKRGFTDIEVVPINGLYPAKAPLDAPVVKAASAAAQTVYGQEPVIYPLMAGSGPMYPLTQALGIPALAAGVGYAESNLHAPNENVRLEDYFEGIRFVGELIRRFAAG
jgi:acetylornithine deacetylase/succinyl-diaminopimelate desuccinylase-like protein